MYVQTDRGFREYWGLGAIVADSVACNTLQGKILKYCMYHVHKKVGGLFMIFFPSITHTKTAEA